MNDEAAVTEKYDDLSQKKENRKKRLKLVITELFLDFSENSTLHGLRYMTQIGHSTVEKMFWLLMFVISVVLCSLLIVQVWFKWRDSPVIVTINERMIPVEEVPFPSVTICPQMKSKLTEYDYAKKHSKYVQHLDIGYDGPLNDTIESELKMLDDALLVCDSYSLNRHVLKNNITNESTIHNIVKIAPTLEESLMLVINWRWKHYAHYSMFSRVLTSEGVCFTFNTVQQKDMFKNESIQNNYFYIQPPELNEKKEQSSWMHLDVENVTVYPRRGQESGLIPDLDVMFHEEVSDNDGSCNNLYSGYKVYLHHPDDMPQSSLYYYPVMHGEVTSLAVKVSAMSTSESLMKHTPEVRQCYSSSDHELRYFKKYTLKNCKLECLSINIYKRCGCVPFYMPHSNSSEICPAKKRLCILETQKSNDLKASTGDVCNCLPSCDSIEYDAEILRTKFEWKKYMKSLDYIGDHSNIHYSKLEVYFKEPRFVSMRRSEMFGLTEFLAYCGGLLGLFLGFSFLSIVEIFFFCTLRLWYALKRDKEESKNCYELSPEDKKQRKEPKKY